MSTPRARARRKGFRDRTEAGRALAAALAPVVSAPCVVAAVPRGGVAVALPIVERLGLPLTVVYARKLTAPFAAELAFGALDEDGEALLDAATVGGLSLGPEDIEEAKARVSGEIRRRMALYRVPPLAHYLPGSAVVLVDDGLATGLTMRAALAYARRHGALETVVAVPCASAQAVERVRQEADRVVSLIVEEDFRAVSVYYADFSPVTDEQVVAMLADAGAPSARRGAPGSGRRLSFRNSRGLELAGEILLPAGAGPHPAVVFAHGWGSGMDTPRNRAVAEALRANGVAVLLFDFTGQGESEGTSEEGTPAQHVDDLGAALGELETLGEVDAGRMAVLGTGSGGEVALLRAAADPRIRALVLRSTDPAGAEVAAPLVTAPTLLVVGEQDVPIRAANEGLLDRLGGPGRVAVVPGGDHLLEEPSALRRVIDLTVAWFDEHLGRGVERAGAGDRGVEGKEGSHGTQ